jgi:hypothetical protein
MDETNAKFPNLESGEIRRLIADPDHVNFEVDDRLVVVLESHEHLDGTATVALVDYLVNLATDRDFLVPASVTKAPFDLALWIDFTSRVSVSQLSDSPIFGRIDQKSLRKADHLAAVVLDDGFYNFVENHELQIGDYVPQVGDKVWLYRSNSMDLLNILSVPLDSELSMKRFLKTQESRLQEPNQFTLEIKTIKDATILSELSIEASRAVLV